MPLDCYEAAKKISNRRPQVPVFLCTFPTPATGANPNGNEPMAMMK
jgi:hypothetical protein